MRSRSCSVTHKAVHCMGAKEIYHSWHTHLDMFLHLYSQYITPSFEGPQVMQQESLLLCLFISGSHILPSHAIHKVHVADVLKSHIQAAAHTSSVGFCKRPLW